MLLDRLEQRLPLLAGGARDLPERQRTLTATIDWSYQLLSEPEQRLFARLSVFSGGCTLDAAEEVCDADLDTLHSLVDKSLLRHGDDRYWMLETLREYASARLAESGELDDSRRRHAGFVLKLTSQLEFASGTDDELRKRFLLEQDNFRDAVAWAAQEDQTEDELELLGRTWSFWWYRGDSAEGLRRAESALARSKGERTGRRAKVLSGAAMFAFRAGEIDLMRKYAEESLDIAEDLEELRSVGWPLVILGLVATETEAVDEATDFFEQAIGVARDTGDRLLAGTAINNLGDLALRQGEPDRAVTLFEESLAIARELAHLDDIALMSYNLALGLHHAGRTGEAVDSAKEGLALAREIEASTPLVDTLVLLAALARLRDKAEFGARLMGAAQTFGDRIGNRVTGVEAQLHERTVEELLNVLGRERYERAHAEGQSMSIDDAVDYALSTTY